MKPYRSALILVCLYISTKSVYAQDSYFATDSSVFSGVSILNGGFENGKRIIRVSTTDRVFKFTAEDIKEYGMTDGTVFVSKEIELWGKNQMVFLELLFNGKHKLYQYTEGKYPRFFIEKENEFFTELVEENKKYRIQLNTIFNGYPQISGNVKLLKFKKKYLIKLLENLNKNLNRPVPHTKIGLSAILNQPSLNVPDDIKNKYLSGLSFERNKTFGLGVYIETPIEMSNLTLKVGLNYQNSSLSGNKQKDSIETDIVVNLSSVDVPIMLRYTIPKFRWMPFFNLGGNFMHNIKTSNDFFVSERKENTIIIKKIEDLKVINRSMVGFFLGTGVQYQLNYRCYISSEIQYSRFFSAEHSVGIDQIQLIVSFSF